MLSNMKNPRRITITEKAAKELDQIVWQEMKSNPHCFLCSREVPKRVMYGQWLKNHRFLCPDCETQEQLIEKGYSGLQPQYRNRI